jgi:NADH-quinone oxidoreductase subunit J
MARRAWVLPLLFVALLGAGVGIPVFVRTTLPPMAGQAVLPREVGLRLFTGDLVLVELASLLLLAGLVAAFHLGRAPK